VVKGKRERHLRRKTGETLSLPMEVEFINLMIKAESLEKC